jgi:hypothetical protein
MVSGELRNFKPYAIHVRVLKYSILTDKNARDLEERIKNCNGRHWHGNRRYVSIMIFYYDMSLIIFIIIFTSFNTVSNQPNYY